MKLGDAIEKAVKPVAQVLNLPCLDQYGNLRPESGCAKRRDSINKFADAAFDIFWNLTKEDKQE
jgi:hypothetical protein